MGRICDTSKIVTAVELYRTYYPRRISAKNGQVAIPKRFVIPLNSKAWPQETWGMKLGNLINGIRHKGYYAEHHERLRELGIDINNRIIRTPVEKVIEAIEAYRSNYPESVNPSNGLLSVKRNFIVPVGDPAWPEESWGMDLGKHVTGIQLKGYHSSHQDKFEELGIRFQGVQNGGAKIVQGLEAYRAVYPDRIDNSNLAGSGTGTILIQKRFIIPSGDPAWPPATWGMKLGAIVNSVKNRGSYQDYHGRFRELGLHVVASSGGSYHQPHPSVGGGCSSIGIDGGEYDEDDDEDDDDDESEISDHEQHQQS